MAHLFDATRCIGCTACIAACLETNHPELLERDIPGHDWLGSNIRRITLERARRPQMLLVQCQHCSDAPCISTCPFGANWRDPETGLVKTDESLCVGCSYCVASCPYDVRWTHPDTGVPMKCMGEGCEALVKAGRSPACVAACPVGIRIPDFIAALHEGRLQEAADIISEDSSLPSICGRVCPQESQCEGKCTRGIKNEPVGIGRLERFVADWHRENVHTAPVVPESNGHKVAIIGAGPAGLTAAGDLAKLGYKVTVYEALHVAGGVLMYGIPEFRLPKAIVQQEIDGLKKMGVDFECNMVIGKVLTIDELMGEYGYEAVFVGSGAGLPRFMGIPGESLKGVYSANEFLTRSNLMKAYLPTSKTPIRTGKKVAVVGGGNVAMDAARSALRLGAETVYIVYRRGMAELPARKEEVEHAEEEGIIFKTLCNPVEILPDENGFVKAITCIEMELGEPDASGRRRPIEKKGSEFTMDVDTVIMSLGTSPNPLIRSTTPGLETNKHGCIVTEGDEGKTSRKGVYAGGDAVTGAATVIKAMGAGKAAAKAIDEYIQNK